MKRKNNIMLERAVEAFEQYVVDHDDHGSYRNAATMFHSEDGEEVMIDGWLNLHEAIRAALMTLAEPTKEMILAGETAIEDFKDSDWDSGSDGEGHFSYEYLRPGVEAAVFVAMLKEALNDT